MLHAKCYMPNATCKMLHAKFYMQNATCELLHAKCFIQNAYMQYAKCKMLILVIRFSDTGLHFDNMKFGFALGTFSLLLFAAL